MAEPRKSKSRTLRRVAKLLPGNRVVIHFEKRNPKLARCASCGTSLFGAPRARQTRLKNMAKTERRPERPYGGVLCSACSRQKIKLSARKQND